MRENNDVSHKKKLIKQLITFWMTSPFSRVQNYNVRKRMLPSALFHIHEIYKII